MYATTALRRTLLLSLALVCFMLTFATPPPPATTHHVDLLTDGPGIGLPGEFRYELENAAAGDTVYIDVAGVVNLAQTVQVVNSVIVIGPNPIHFTVDGAAIGGPAIQVMAGGGSPAEFHNFRVTNGAGEGVVIDPGALADFKFMVFQDCNGGSTGGGMANNGGVVNVTSCSFINNIAGNHGGGIFTANGGNLTVVNTTFFTNQAANNGGAIYNDGGATLTLTNNTLYLNDCSGIGGGVHGGSGTINLRNNIVWGNTNGGGPATNNLANGGALWNSTGGNVINNNPIDIAYVTPSGFPPDNFSIANDPLISRASPLVDGLGMQYFPIQNAASVAVDIDNTSTNPSGELYDARLSYRQHLGVGNRMCDAGAIEFSPFTVRNDDGNMLADGLGDVIQNLNAAAPISGPYSVVFEISGGPYIINHGSAINYDIFQDGTTVNGYTQEGSMCAGPGGPGMERTPALNLIEINGAPTVGQPGIHIFGNDVTIAGLTITNHNMFAQIGILVDGDQAMLVGNHIGVSPNGLNALPNDAGIFITIDDVRVGGPADGSNGYLPGMFQTRGNVISGNTTVQIDDQGYGNYFRGNLIGPDATGMSVPTGAPTAVGMYIDNGQDKVIGGDRREKSNVISGNSQGMWFTDPGFGFNSIVYGNFIGTDITGLAPLGNVDGIFIDFNVTGLNIGGPNPGEGNIISGNFTGAGIVVDNAVGVFIQGNTIGLDKDDNLAIANDVGIALVNGANGNMIGGLVADEGNIISGNTQFGIDIIDPGTGGNFIYNNIIGLDGAGVLPRPNQTGVGISGNSANDVGFNSIYPNGGNVISGNSVNGIAIAPDAGPGITIMGNVIGLQADGLTSVGANTQNGISLDGDFVSVGTGSGPGLGGTGNIISGNGGFGIAVTGDDNLIINNWIGVDVVGAPDGNNIGVWVNGANNTQISGGDFFQIISSNTLFGIELTNGASNTYVDGNFIGTDGTGDGSAGHANGAGIRLANGANNNYIGWSSFSPSNVISGNSGDGIELLDPTTVNNFIAHNFIGVRYSNTTIALANGGNGISTNNVGTNYLGQHAALQIDNVISGNGLNGIFVGGGSNDVRIYGNMIGTDLSGGVAVPNTFDGIVFNSSNDNFVGFDIVALPYARNIISGNTGAGISIQNSTGNLIASNYIGLDATGSGSIGTQQDGIIINGNSNNNVIGGGGNTINLITGNQNYGILLDGALVTSNTIQNNWIGLAADGASAVGNTFGMRIENGANNNFIGGPGLGNVISGNGSTGINLNTGATSNFIEGNLIGPRSTGSANVIGVNQTYGIDIESGANTNYIGTAIAGNGNVIGFNTMGGIYIRGIGTDDNQIVNNRIGCDSPGISALPNNDGIIIDDGAAGTLIGDPINTDGLNVISGNSNYGIWIDGSSNTVDNTIIFNNHIGVDLSGLAALPNSNNGIYAWGASNLTIGGPGTNEFNVISANMNNGIEVEQATSTNLVIQSNMIGVDVNGANSGPLGNGNNGIALRAGVTGATIGGSSGLSEGNIIGGHIASAGIMITDSDNNDIFGNNIGIGPLGTLAQQEPNFIGIVVESPGAGSTGNTIGGFVGSGLDNIIASNNYVQVVLDGAGSVNNTILGNLIGVDINQDVVNPVPNGRLGVVFNQTGVNMLGGSMGTDDNVIGGLDTAVVCLGSSNVNVYGNYIGVRDDGSTVVANQVGVAMVAGASNNVIGNSGGTNGNVISGNNLYGVHIGDGGSTGNIVQENIIGLDGSGLAGVPNGVGVVITTGASTNTIGPANVISGNTAQGIIIRDAGTSGNTVTANLIGTDITGNNGTVATQNTTGVNVTANASGNIIGIPGGGNVISGNGFEGVLLDGSSSATTVQGNHVGLGLDGTTGVGNLDFGIGLSFTSGNTIGGNGAIGEGNFITNNTNEGIRINDSNGDVIYGNSIGLDTGGSPAGNGGDGIALVGNASGINIGITGTPNNANEIANNGNHGIRFSGPPPNAQINISENSIHDNVALGIDLENDGASPNDAGDVDGGENFGQNFPVISSAFDCGTGGVTTNVTFNCDFVTGNTYRIEFFTADAANQEGQIFLGGGTVLVTAANEEFTIGIPFVTVGTQIVATATDVATGNTSEFSFPSFAVTTSPTAPTLSMSTMTVCVGELPATVVATGAGAPNTEVWYTDNPPTLANHVSTGSTLNLPPFGAAGSFQYYAYDSVATCYSPSALLTITVNPLPAAIDQSPFYCEDSFGSGSAVIDLTTLDSSVDGGAGNSVSWWSDAGCSVSIPSPTTYNAFNGAMVYALVHDGSCYDTATVTITVYALPGGSFTNTNPSCFGFMDGMVDLTMSSGTAPFTYSWTGPGGPYSTQDLTGVGSGTYNLIISDNNGCVNTYVQTLTDPPGMSIPTPSFTDVSCNGLNDGTTAVGTVTGGTPGYTYAWQQVGVGATGGTGTTDSGLGAGDYYVLVTDAAGCALSSDTVTISEPTAVTINPIITDASCAGNCDGMIVPQPVGGTLPYGSFAWMNSVPVTVGANDTLFSACADTYTLDIMDANGCLFSFTGLVVNEPAPLLITTTVTDETCGALNGAIEVTATGGTSPYDFQLNNGGFNTFANPHTFGGLGAGVDTTQVMDANGCLSNVVIDTIVGTGGILFTANFFDPVCAADTGWIQIDGVSGGTPPYQFSIDNGTTWSADSNFFGLFAGVYDVLVTDGVCTSFVQVTLVDPPAITYTLTINQASCDSADGEIFVTASGGNGGPYVYAVTSTDTLINNLTGTFTGLPPNNYLLVVIDGGGCSTGQSIVISQPSASICDDLGAPNAFSPDGDGTNDTWIVDPLYTRPDNYVAIYNRWGDLLIDFNGYDNNTVVWEGTNSSGELLPSGTYFYIIELTSEERYFNGWVHLTR